MGLAPGVREACARLHGAGYALVLIAPQPSPRSALKNVEMQLSQLLGLPLAGLHPCLPEAATKYGINPEGSWLVSSRLTDLEAGRIAGCGTIHIDRRSVSEGCCAAMPMVDVRVPDIVLAAAAIMKARNRLSG